MSDPLLASKNMELKIKCSRCKKEFIKVGDEFVEVDDKKFCDNCEFWSFVKHNKKNKK